MGKRYTIFWRRPFSEILLLILPVIVTIALKSFLKSGIVAQCSDSSRFEGQTYTPYRRLLQSIEIPAGSSDLLRNSQTGFNNFISGQASWAAQTLTNGSIPQAINLLNSTISGAFRPSNSFSNWYSDINTNYSSNNPGGFFSDPNQQNQQQAYLAYLAYLADSDGGVYTGSFLLNMLTNLFVNGDANIITNFSPYKKVWSGISGKVLQFTVYLGFTMAVAPAFATLYPTFERLSKVRAMQYSNGLRVTPLWSAYLVYNFIPVIISSIIVIIFINNSIDNVFGAGYLFFVFLLYGICSVLFSFFISLFVKSQLGAFAAAAAYQCVFVLVYLVGFLATQVYGDPLTMDTNIKIIYYTTSLLGPSSSLIRSFFVAFNIFGILCDSNSLESGISYPGNISAYGGPILYLILQSILLFLFLIAYDSGKLHKFNAALFRKKNGKGKKNEAQNFFYEDTEETKEMGPKEVEDEAHEIATNQEKYNNGLVLKNVYQNYGGSKNIVDNVSFGVQKGECFALLGPNGAGKTTTFNMIRGETLTSSGDIFVTGISITEQRALARTKLGVCPQFDAMDKMTVVEVLKFYAKLRGIERKSIKKHVNQLIEAVDLERFRSRMANKLSGGNKRKLSLAVALIGNPEVLLLDEPSSGMDAFAKRIMWNTLSMFAPGRSIVLTTHSMEEADALANRAGILAHKMLALGTADFLRHKYSNHYHIHMVCDSAPHTSNDTMMSVVKGIEGLFPGAKIEDRMYQGQIKMAIPILPEDEEANEFGGIMGSKIQFMRQGEITEASGSSSSAFNNNPIKVSSIFRLLEQHKSRLGLRSYSVYPTRLEEVFLKIVGDYVDETSH